MSKVERFILSPANDTENMFEVNLEGWRPKLTKSEVPDPSGFTVTVIDEQVVVDVTLTEPELGPGETEPSYDTGLDLVMCGPEADKAWVEECLNGWWPFGAVVDNATLDGVEYQVIAAYFTD